MEQDTLARDRITREIDRNFFVEAAAGSGKTSSLVDRMIAMVGAGIDVSQICAITFTKAAAKEFYGRFQNALAKKLSHETNADLREKYAAALRNIDLCFMGTIDAFSNLLLHEHPLEAGMPSETAVCAGNEAMPQYLAEYARIKRGEYGEELQKKYELFRSVQLRADTVFANCISRFTERREAEFIYQKPDPDADIERQFRDWKIKLIHTLQFLHNNSEYVSDNKTIRKAYQMLPEITAALGKDWNLAAGEVINALKKLDNGERYHDKNLRLQHTAQHIMTPDELNLELPEVFHPHLKKNGSPAYYYISTTDTDAYIALKRLQYAATMDFLSAAASAIAEEMRRNGTMTFHDALISLRDMLKADAEKGGQLIRHIAERHSYYLVDEFQDTDPLQAEAVFYLAAKDPQPDWTACVPRPGSLFIVGDPKQSIYRFRGADVSSFMRVKSLFAEKAGEVLMLSRNFRSTVRIRNWFNQVFPDMLTESEDVQSAFHPIPIGESETDTAFTGVYTYPSAIGEHSRLTDDPAQVAKVIQMLIGNPAVRLKNGKPPKFSDIMVISYRKDQTAEIAKELQKQGIPVRVEGKINLKDCPALIAAARIFAAAADPTDAMSVFSALTSEIFGISQQMIRRFCSIGGKLNACIEQEEICLKFPEIGSALAKLRKYAQSGRSCDSAALFEIISDDLRLFSKTGSQSLEYFFYALELLRQAEAGGEVLLHCDAAKFLSELLTNSGKERCVSLEPDDNRVHIANLHKVKGLQAPIVILADPKASDHAPDLRVVHRADRTECRVFTLKKDNIVYAETDGFSSDFNSECECMSAEKQRLLYVAATRAENILIIGDSIKENGERYSANPWQAFLPFAEGTAADCIPPNPTAVEAPTVRTDCDLLYEKADKQSVLAGAAEAEPTYTIIRPSKIKLKPIRSEAPEDADDDRLPLSRDAALTGTLVHKLMECIVSGGVPADKDALIAYVLNEYNANPVIYAPMLQKVLRTMTDGGYPQEDDVPEDLLSALRQADAVYCEVPFCLRRGNEIVNGVIDLLCRSGEKWKIIDYKTNAESAGLSEKYAAQLDAYKEAVREIIGAEADAAIYHIDV